MFLFPIFLLGFIIAMPVAQAHVLKTDGTISVVLHVDPNDDPVPGENANLYFSIKDTTGKFTLKECNCTVVISESGKVVFSSPVTNTGGSASLVYSFPKRDVYTIQLTGFPLNTNQFDPFTVSYIFRVEKELPVQSSHADTFIYYILIGGGLSGIIGWILYRTYRQKKRL